MSKRTSIGVGTNEAIRSSEDLEKLVSSEELKEGEQSLFQQVRELVESLVVALFLAFLFKTFEAEAFVIPTGSMAPTLMGRHKDVECSQCSYQFQVSASEEMDSSSNRRNGRHVVAGTCPQCGFTQYFGDEVPNNGRDAVAQSFTGDRILVSKLAFDQRELRRFDISVFRSPAEPKINFIKRIVGFPNERLRVQYGDLFVQKIDESDRESDVVSSDFGGVEETNRNWSPDVDLGTIGDFRTSKVTHEASIDGRGFIIQRKDYEYLRQILQVVYDADYSVPILEKLGWPSRWSDDWKNGNEGYCGWIESKTQRSSSFVFSGNKTAASQADSSPRLTLASEADISPLCDEDRDFAWLRYRHIVPSSKDWYYLERGELPPEILSSSVIPNNPRLIDDFTSYNAGIARMARMNELTGDYEWNDVAGDEFSELVRRTDEEQGGRYFCFKNPDGFGCNWVGDLGVSCSITWDKSFSATSALCFDLVKGGVVFRCLIEPFNDTIKLFIPSVKEFECVQTQYHFKPSTTYKFSFYNVDEEMRVAVDDCELSFADHGGRYDALSEMTKPDGSSPLPRNRDPNSRDLSPAAIGARDVSVKINNLKLLRDVYYIAAGRFLEPWDSAHYVDFGTSRCDRLASERVYLGNEDEVAKFMSSPSLWKGYGNSKSILLRQGADQYVAFGDNSGFSLDSRLWATNKTPHYVDKNLLIGKAFYVYWPHGKPLPFIAKPYWPNFSKMRHVD